MPYKDPPGDGHSPTKFSAVFGVSRFLEKAMTHSVTHSPWRRHPRSHFKRQWFGGAWSHHLTQTRPKDTKAAPIKAAEFADLCTEIIARSGLTGPPSLSCFFASHARAGAADAPRHDEVCGRFRQTIDLWAADTWRLMVELTNQKKWIWPSKMEVWPEK